MKNWRKLQRAKAILSDWDDTKVSTFPRIVEITDSFAKTYSLPLPGADGLLKFWGSPRQVIIHGLFGEFFPHLTPIELEEMYLASIPKDYHPYPIQGVEEAVKKLASIGYVQGIVSSGPKANIERDLNFHYPSIKHTYTFILGAEDTAPYHKPHPRVFDACFAILSERGINEDESIYVGDYYTDFQAAKNRGMIFIGVVNNPKAKEKFLEQGLEEEMMIESFSDLPHLLGQFGLKKV